MDYEDYQEMGELKDEIAKLREQLATAMAKLIVNGSHSEHRFDVISMTNGKQVHHMIRDIYAADPTDPFSKTRIIIS